jgi:hypothetical protein
MDITKPVDKSKNLWNALSNDADAQGVTMERQIVAELEGIYKRLGKLEDRLLHGLSEPCQRCADQWNRRPAEPQIDVCPVCGAQLPRGEPCPNCSAPSPPVYRLEMTGAGEAVATFTDGDGAGQRNTFCGDLEILMDLLCCTYGGPFTAYTAAHNALGQSIKNAIEAFRAINAAHSREKRAEIADLDSDIPF